MTPSASSLPTETITPTRSNTPTGIATPSQTPVQTNISPSIPISVQPIAFYGDCRNDQIIHQRIVDDIINIKPSAVFCTGDLVNDATNADQWAVFDQVTSGLRGIAPFYPAIGNHDVPLELFLKRFPLLNHNGWYAVNIDNLHFIVLNTQTDLQPGSKQYAWLETSLQAARNDFVAVIDHIALLSTGSHGGDAKLAGVLTPLFEKYNVDIVINGHDHDYERSSKNGIYYIVTGGGGAPLEKQKTTSPYSQFFLTANNYCTLSGSSDSLKFEAFDISNKVIDSFSIKLGSN